MSRQLSRLRSRRAALITAAVGAASVLVPSLGRAAMTVSLSAAPLGTAGTFTSSSFLTRDANSTDVPIYVYATVTGANTVTTGSGTTATAPVTTGDFDGLQYLYYNILNSGANELAGGLDTVNVPVLNATLGFGATGPDISGNSSGGAQVGKVQNIPNGVSLGANASSVAMTDYAKPRAAQPVWDNNYTFNQSTGMYTYRNDGTNIIVNGNSVSFLVETLNFKPTAFNASTPTSRVQTTFTVQVPTLTGVAYAGTNYFLDSNTSGPATAGSLAAVTKTAYTAGSGVTVVDSLSADANGDGRVDGSDLAIVLGHFGVTTPLVSNGNFNATTDPVVDGSDLALVLGNFGENLSPVTPGSATNSVFADAALFADPAAVNLLKSYGFTPVAAVPEPGSIALIAAVGAASVARRRRRR